MFLLTLFATDFAGVKSCEDHTVVRFSCCHLQYHKNKNLKTLPSLLLHVLPNLFTGIDDRNPTSEERPPWEILYKREVTPCVVMFCRRVVHGRKRTKYFPSIGVMTITFFFTVFFKMEFWNFGIVQCAINVRLQRDNSPASPLGVIWHQDRFYLTAGILELCSKIVKRRSPYNTIKIQWNSLKRPRYDRFFLSSYWSI